MSHEQIHQQQQEQDARPEELEPQLILPLDLIADFLSKNPRVLRQYGLDVVSAKPEADTVVFASGLAMYDKVNGVLEVADSTMKLNPQQERAVSLLVNHLDLIVSRRRLIEEIYGPYAVANNATSEKNIRVMQNRLSEVRRFADRAVPNLGDTNTGMIRRVNSLGYVAVTDLSQRRSGNQAILETSEGGAYSSAVAPN